MSRREPAGPEPIAVDRLRGPEVGVAHQHDVAVVQRAVLDDQLLAIADDDVDPVGVLLHLLDETGQDGPATDLDHALGQTVAQAGAEAGRRYDSPSNSRHRSPPFVDYVVGGFDGRAGRASGRHRRDADGGLAAASGRHWRRRPRR